MIKNLIIFLFFSVSIMRLYAGNGDYAVSNIPAALLKNANVVKRMEEIKFEIVDIGKAKEYYKYAITILNENGDKAAKFYESYDKLRSIESIDAVLYDGNGKKIKSLKKSDIEDLSGTSQESLIESERIKFHDFYYKVYPYTVEYEVAIKFNYTMFFPIWEPQDKEHLSVEESKMTVICPQDYKLRYKAFNFSKQPLEASQKSALSYTWEIANLPAIESEYASPDWYELVPTVMLGPNEFQVEGYKGTMDTWKDFGKFIYSLKVGRDELPDDIKQKVHQMTDGLSDQKQKVSRLYEFLQQNTRYVSVQLGIGGWQPFDAKYVASKKYGDCKALTNYMYSLLKEAGIKSCYTLIRAGQNASSIVSDFPSQQFNHVILCVPLSKDSIWLECTSQSLPAGYLSGFTANRYALMIDESGGTLVRTPKYGLKENLQERKIVGAINDEGDLSSTVKTKYKAIQQDELESMINYLSKDKIMEQLKKEIDLPTYDVVKFDYKEEKDVSPPVIDETLELTASNYAQVSGRRLFVNPNILNKTYRKLKEDPDRKYGIELTLEYRDIDTVELNIPSGYKAESIPPDIKYETKFGKYTSTTKVTDDKIIYVRQNEKYSGNFPASDYPELAKYYEQLYKADRSKVVLVKKE
ncbi:MAG: hypothetical protein C5B59_16355 [Bacteroidetes bacterium]|nr:MAG: hypothetical protein C5B59_16355 [Bacteroidota bacterium]